MSTATPDEGALNADIGRDNRGNIVRVGPGGSTGDVADTIIHGDLVIQLSPEFLSRLREAPTTAAPASNIGPTDAPAVDISRYAPVIEEALGRLRVAEQSGRAVDGVQAGDVRVSKVELLLKRAVVVKAEAAQMMAENATAKQQELQGLLLRFQGAGRFDSGAIEQFQSEGEALIWRGFDRATYTSKLTEAKALFEEALAIDETNGEALLQLADLLMALTPDDVSDEERILARAHALFGHPATDDERFMQAQALLLSAMSLQLKHRRTPPGPELLAASQMYQAALTEAIGQFRKLDRTIWATAADNMLQASRAAVATWSGTPQPGAPTSMPYGAAQAGWQPAPAPPPFALGGPGAFQPAGQWAVTVTTGGIVTESAYLTLGADQSLQGVMSWSRAEIRGRWDFAPMNGVLSLQGLTNGVIPSALYIQILTAQGNEATGVDGSGNVYTFLRYG